MIKKLIIFLIKVIPIITLYKGVEGGGVKISSSFSIVKIAFTEYELAQLTRLVADYYINNSGKLVTENEFPSFILANYKNPYAKTVREIFSKKGGDITLDIWVNPYQLIYKPENGRVLIRSSAVDCKYGTTDDIEIGFNVVSKSKNDRDIKYKSGHSLDFEDETYEPYPEETKNFEVENENYDGVR